MKKEREQEREEWREGGREGGRGWGKRVNTCVDDEDARWHFKVIVKKERFYSVGIFLKKQGFNL